MSTTEKPKSALKRYRELVVGKPGLWAFLRFEMRTGLCAYLPGVIGLGLRQKLYKGLFAAMGRGCTLGVGVVLRQPGAFTMGRGVMIGDYVQLSARGGTVRLGDEVVISRNTVFDIRNGTVEIGSRTTVGGNCRLASTDGAMKIGRDCMIAAYSYIGPAGHRFDRTDIPMNQQGMDTRGGAEIGDDVWVGARSMVMDGVKIGEGSVIGAGSMITRDVPAMSVAYGVPAKVYRKRTEGASGETGASGS